MARRSVAVSVLAAMTGLFVAGCGDGDDGPERLTQAEFASQANTICQVSTSRVEAAAAEAFPEGGPTPTEEAVVAFAEEKAIPAIEEQVRDLDALVPPEDVEARFEEAVAKARAVLDEVKKEPKKLATDTGLFAESDQLFGAVGLETCAR